MQIDEAMLRKIVFECSVVYSLALTAGKSVQEAEWLRKAKLDAFVKDIRRREYLQDA
jgi:hypothetical protein